MVHLHLISLAIALMLVGIPGLSTAGSVEINGVPIPRAVSAIDATQDIVEFRAGGSQIIQLVPSLKRYGVCVTTQAPVALLDSELPTSDTPSRFVVRVEDGRAFSQCLLASVNTDGSRKRRLTYCLRCEDVTAP